jgi:hypothetical protein
LCTETQARARPSTAMPLIRDRVRGRVRGSVSGRVSS